ncbi:penicillin acylase family protein [Pseudomonas sp. NPDC087342]|uniref:penicillin acylase family protein n=1 Tax=Pseudomonas sp. NPDC087342 TaxID=3364437 RepID=UPI0037FA8FBB
MRNLVTSMVLTTLCFCAVEVSASDASRWQQQASNVNIIRDKWGIAHVYGKTDADAVFGMIYTQAEDDFNRIEQNYLVNLGWLAQADGESGIYSDLRTRLFVDTDVLKHQFSASPVWLQKLMVSWADGLNYYLDQHPGVKPRFIKHFEPWMALAFTEGSIGGDIEGVALDKLEAFYGQHPPAPVVKEKPDGGSNGFAIAPALSASGHALLYINPHTSHYFRSELQMVSQEGLNTYGVATWGQFFIYQGFNDYNGWMHTSYGGDAIDEYQETIVEKPDGPYYKYGDGLRKLKVSQISVPFKKDGVLAHRDFTVYHSHHGPIIRAENGKWIAIKLLQTPVTALEQSFLRTKTKDYKSFYKTQEMRTDTSNNTVYADRDGTIAYFHGNFIPKRDPQFDFRSPVDGSNPKTEWMGPHKLEDTIMVKNPKSGWVQNTNAWPFSAAGAQSPRKEDFPAYMWTAGENQRDIHAVDLLEKAHNVTLDSLIALGYDNKLNGFDVLLPPLFNAYDQLADDAPLRARLKAPIESLRAWDHRSGVASVPTTLASFWGQALVDLRIAQARAAKKPVFDLVAESTSDSERLAALDTAISKLEQDFGRWDMPWGEVNRFQRITDDIVSHFDDAKPSFPVAWGSSVWGALASFISPSPRSTKKLYATTGNSFIAAIEFGPKIHAKALMAGGESGDPSSPHFADQAEMFSKGEFRDVLFYKADIAANTERKYHPGE